MEILVFACLLVAFLGFLELIKATARYQETKLKKVIIDARSAKKVSTHFIVQESKPVRLLTLIFFAFLLLLFFDLLFQWEMNTGLALLWWVLVLSGTLYLVAYCHMRRVIVSDQRITYKSLFKKTSFLFEEITKVKFGMNLTLIIYCEGKRMFAVETNCEGYYTLLTRLIFEGVFFENPPVL